MLLRRRRAPQLLRPTTTTTARPKRNDSTFNIVWVVLIVVVVAAAPHVPFPHRMQDHHCHNQSGLPQHHYHHQQITVVIIISVPMSGGNYHLYHHHHHRSPTSASPPSTCANISINISSLMIITRIEFTFFCIFLAKSPSSSLQSSLPTSVWKCFELPFRSGASKHSSRCLVGVLRSGTSSCILTSDSPSSTFQHNTSCLVHIILFKRALATVTLRNLCRVRGVVVLLWLSCCTLSPGI